MLVLSRKVGQKLLIGDQVEIVVTKISGQRVAIGIEAPPEVSIVRGELRAADLASEACASEPVDEVAPAAVPLRLITASDEAEPPKPR